MYVCVYGSAVESIDKSYRDEGYKLGKELAKNNHSIVFGGGSEGMMGAVAKGGFENGGKIYGIAPVWMKNFEGIFSECEQFIYTKSMDERKNLFLEKSDAFIITPGGLGTLDEFFEILTLKKLKQHNKKIIIFNINNFFDEMFTMMMEMSKKEFIPKDNLNLYNIVNTVDEIISLLKN